MHRKAAFMMIFLGTMAMAFPAQSPDPRTWRATISTADQLMRDGRLLDAEGILQSALEQARRLEPDLAPTAITYEYLGALYADMRMHDESARACQRSLHLWEKVGRSADGHFLHAANNLVALYAEWGDLDQAERHERSLVAPRIKTLNREDPEFARVLTNLGSIQILKHQYSKAIAFFEQALTILERAAPEPSMEMASALNNLAVSLMRAGQADRAIECNRRAIAMLESAGGSSGPVLPTVLTNAASLLCIAHRCAEGEPLIQRALALARNAGGEDTPLTAAVLSQYSAALKSGNRKQEAADMDRRAREIQARFLRSGTRQTVDIRELSRCK